MNRYHIPLRTVWKVEESVELEGEAESTAEAIARVEDLLEASGDHPDNLRAPGLRHLSTSEERLDHYGWDVQQDDITMLPPLDDPRGSVRCSPQSQERDRDTRQSASAATKT